MLPRSLQAQLEEADRMIATIEGTAPADTPTAVPGTEPEPVQPEPVVTPQPQPVVVEQPEETWKQKYLTLKGIFEAEKHRLESALESVGYQAQNLMTENADLRAQLQHRPEPQQPVAKKLTDADRETFGAELVDLIERATSTPAPADNAEVRAALARIAELEAKLGQVKATQVESKQETFWKTLAKDVPNWETINASDAWKAWLMQVDPVYGVNRQAGLDVAFKHLDAERVVTIFRTFLDAQPAPKPTPQQELQRQVTPTRSRASTEPPQAQGGMIWTNDSIEAFYRDQRKGLLTEEQAAAYEEDLNRAAAEGRLRE